jgi:Lrp/AsnC family transcriptional regulator
VIRKPALDGTDRKILAILQDDASLPVAEVAARVNLSQTPCWRRISGWRPPASSASAWRLLDPDKIGCGITVFVAVESGDHSQEWLERFAAAVGDMPEVLEVHRMAGDIDYFLRVAVADMPAYDAFYRRLIAAVPVKNITSRFSMERVKSTDGLPDRGLNRATTCGWAKMCAAAVQQSTKCNRVGRRGRSNRR